MIIITLKRDDFENDEPDNNNDYGVNKYIQKSFKAKLKSDQNLITSTPKSEQLKMYLAGMGGTEKSRVINALIKIFKSKNESYHIVVLGPTGSSAALINGSTYYSFLAIT